MRCWRTGSIAREGRPASRDCASVGGMSAHRTSPYPWLPAGFPPIEPWHAGWLDVGHGHEVYFEQCGKPDGSPLLILHGGPGSGSSPRMRQLFDPTRFRIMLFDQRGCGRSTPRGACQHNTTDELVADIERLRLNLGVERWIVAGGSWGAALAVAYAASHRNACLGLVLRGVFLTGARDLDWFFGGAAAHAPDAWLPLAQAAGSANPLEIRQWMIETVLGDDHVLAIRAVQHWIAWETALETGTPVAAQSLDDEAADRALAKYRIQAHYLRHTCFLGEDTLLRLATRLADLPVAILHGGEDRVCRPDNALRLQRAIAGSRLEIVTGAGHNPFDPAMQQALSRALAHLDVHRDFSGWGRNDGI